MDRFCKKCGECINHRHFNAAYCSMKCKKQMDRDRLKQWRLDNPEAARERDAAMRKQLEQSGYAARYRAERRSSKAGYADRFMERMRLNTPETDVDRAYLMSLFGDACAVTNVPFNFDRTIGSSFTNPYAPSIDRIDSNIGYIRGNIHVVLSAVNFAKSSMTMDDFVQVWRDISKSWSALVD